ncbi:EF-hand domain-containing protein [Streptomyces sp. NPDC006692]|uniref:EF-hand domain-containing protein n=1 Tax=unclassified Streptomyces TaxID=2593676 RepID=UPI0036817317
MDSPESVVYERRVAARFASFDQDGNGWIDREDFSAAAAHLLAEFGITARCDKGQALYGGAEALWQGLAGIADVDGDQRVTRQEFVGGTLKRLHDRTSGFTEIARPFLHAAFAVADTAGVGTVSVADAERALRAFGVSPKVAGEVAVALDGDGDGRVTEPDAVAAFAAYFTTLP